jgi:hypothetical protein
MLYYNNIITPSLETLNIKLDSDRDEIQPGKFPKLAKLTIKEDYFTFGIDWVLSSSFPALTDFTYTSGVNYDTYDEDSVYSVIECFCLDKMPKLKRLNIQVNGYEELLRENGSIEFLEPSFQLESLACRLYAEKFCKPHVETLKELKCCVEDFLDYENLLLTLTNLESLSVKIEHYRNYQHQAPFPLIRNEKIKKLGYSPGYDDEEFREPRALYQILSSLPGLETLIYYEKLPRSALEVAGEHYMQFKFN